ncbi:hypothetical protein GCM10009802_27030 [Streptomyces synnematoformans]|uniref:Uncharacterized protein n=1 Tax=Streptomyces synnematoformans TaxID=415721 RepID=A0ABP5JW89_9ACTN
MTPHGVKEVVASLAAGLVVPEGCRGRSTWDRPGQAAELAVRRAAGEHGADALAVVRTEGSGGGSGSGGDRDGDGWRVTVAHRDGRGWDVPVAPRAAAAATPASCGAVPVAQTHMAAGTPRAH